MTSPDNCDAAVVRLAGCERSVGGRHNCLIVAEIGQNHQGDINIAKQLIREAQQCGVDVVKFQKTNLTHKFTSNALERPYIGPHAWADTYGAHKAKLEFSEQQHRQLQCYANELGVMYTASAMDPASADFLCGLNVPFIKIGSGDSDNMLMIESLARQNIPLFISTGMRSEQEVSVVYETVVVRHSRPLVLMQCTSAYPTPVHHVNLSVLSEFQRRFPRAVIGYSGHEIGTCVSVAAVALGAKVIERHLTLDHSWKGSDHASSLLPAQMALLVREVRHVESALGWPIKQPQPSEQPCRNKLAKSVVAARALTTGHVLHVPRDVAVKVATGGDHVHDTWRPVHVWGLHGARLRLDVGSDEVITCAMVDESPPNSV